MANKTTNYELTKPLASEFYDIADQNGNMDIIDAALKKNADAIGKVESASAVTKTSGTGAAYTAEVTGITELYTGLSLIIIPHTQSTSTEPTLNLNSLGAKTIKQRLSGSTGGTASGGTAGWITADKPLSVRYDGSVWVADITKQSAADLNGVVPISSGGTGATSATAARANLGAEAKHSRVTASLATASWDSTSLTQTVSVTGVTAANTVLISPAPSSQEVWGKAQIVCTAQAAGKLTFSCKKVPTAAVTANIVILGG